MDRALSAPGKLFIAGEYAVLWGGVARVLAVGPRVQALVRRREDRVVDLLLEGGRLSGLATPAGVNWKSEVGEAFHFLARTVDLACRAVGTECTGFSLALAPSPKHAGRKLGQGGSGRAVVLAAEATRFALDARTDALKLALLAHWTAQGGAGSGGDVAASFAGGLVRYRRYPLAALARAAVSGGLPSALESAAPVEVARAAEPRLPLVYAFSGESASTGALIAQVERQLGPADRQRFVEQSDALGGALEAALGRGAFDAVRESMEALQALLGTLASTRSEPLQRILALARGLGCAGKQSGAGGGDGAILVAPDEATATLVIDALTERGTLAHRVSTEPGLRGEAAAPAELKAWLDAG